MVCSFLKVETVDQINNFLDYGSGSGILGICMNKKNQKTKIKYIDNDPTALQITKINVRKNNLRKLLIGYPFSDWV